MSVINDFINGKTVTLWAGLAGQEIGLNGEMPPVMGVRRVPVRAKMAVGSEDVAFVPLDRVGVKFTDGTSWPGWRFQLAFYDERRVGNAVFFHDVPPLTVGEEFWMGPK